MKVANALYDVVFKYLMNENRMAKLLLSALLETEILELELKPQEFSVNATNAAGKSLTVYRVDFKARIRLKDGREKVVLIEVQKAKFPSDVMRFRKYLGEQYASKDNVVEKDGKRKPLPIITIYFLGYGISGMKNIPVIRVARRYLDQATGKELKVCSEFIESLTHDSIIVQVEAIKSKKRRTELEDVLTIFEPGMKHVIDIDEKNYPKKYRPIIRHLNKVLQDEKVMKTMEIEDEILEDLQTKEREVEQEREKRKKVEEELKKEAEARKKVEEELKKEAEARKQAEEKMKVLMKRLAIKMLKNKEPIERIIEETGLSEDEVDLLKY